MSFFSIAWTVLRVWPNTIISTGAAPGFFAILVGRLLNRNTIWVDSIANAEELSMSGQKAGKYATFQLTQWEHLAKPNGPQFHGNVLGDTPEMCAPNLGNETPDNCSLKSLQIFVTVGTDQHFNRMVRTIDQWAASNPESRIFAQIGDTDYQPAHFEYSKFLTPQEFTARIQSSSLVIGHAGMGTILTALKNQKPILVMPKLASLGEHRNEHQTATAKHLSIQGIVNVAFNDNELLTALDNLKEIASSKSVGPFASETLTKTLSSFILPH